MTELDITVTDDKCGHGWVEQWTDYQTFSTHIKCVSCGAEVVLPPDVIRSIIEGERIGTYGELLTAAQEPQP